jgi:hypothetical protein
MEPAGPLRALAARVMRFGEINHAIGDISKQMLSRTLKRLEQGGFVKRTLFAEIPPRVAFESPYRRFRARGRARGELCRFRSWCLGL